MEKYGLQLFERQEDVVDLRLLEEDAVTFTVLRSIVNTRSEKVFTDGREAIICHSGSPWPVWIWCGPSACEATFQKVADCLRSEFPTERGYRYNLRPELLEKLKEIDPAFQNLRVEMRLRSFQCRRLLTIEKPCDGGLRPATEKDIPLAARWKQDFSREAERQELPLEICEKRVREQIEAHELHFWENGRREPVAMATRGDEGEIGKVALVYTRPEARRQGYALHLVHRITESILSDGKRPVLYTDADYPASNACYRKIGYQEVGSLYTVCGAGEEP